MCLRHNGKIEIGVEPILSSKPPLLFPQTLDLSKQTHCAGTSKPIFKVVLDVLPTRSSTYTRDKTHYRTMYNYARVCAGIQSYQDAKEVLLYNKDDTIMDCSITTPYFFRDGKWVTPHTDCGGQQGTTRRWAIDQGFCEAGFVQTKAIQHGEIIWLSNGVKGFFTARVVVPDLTLSRPPSYDSRTSSGFTSDSERSAASSMSSVEDTPHVSTHADEDYEDDNEPRRKYAPVKDAHIFRKNAFSLDVFERALKL